MNDPFVYFSYNDGTGDTINFERVFTDNDTMTVTDFFQSVLAFYAQVGFSNDIEIKSFIGDAVSNTLTYTRESYIHHDDTYEEAVDALYNGVNEIGENQDELIREASALLDVIEEKVGKLVDEMREKRLAKEDTEYFYEIFDEIVNSNNNQEGMPIPLRKSLMNKNQVADYVATYGYDAWENLKE